LLEHACLEGGAHRPRILEGWIGEMTNDDRVEGVVAQTCDDVNVTTGQWTTRTTWSVCQPYRLVSYLYYFTTSIYLVLAMFLGRGGEQRGGRRRWWHEGRG
jgi:hypothetical protein